MKKVRFQLPLSYEEYKALSEADLALWREEQGAARRREWVLHHLQHGVLLELEVEYFMGRDQLRCLRRHVKLCWDAGAIRAAWIYFSNDVHAWGVFIHYYFTETFCWKTFDFKDRFNYTVLGLFTT